MFCFQIHALAYCTMNEKFSILHEAKCSIKVSANPKLTVLHNFGFLYHSIDLRNSFRLKKTNTKKCYSYAKLSRENNFAILIALISRRQLLSSRCQIRRDYVTAKHMMRVCVSQNTRDVLKVSSCMNVFEKEKKIVSLFFVEAKSKEKEESF